MSHWLLKVESGGSSLLVVHEWELAGGVSPPTLCGSRYVANGRLRHILIRYAPVSKADGSQSLDLQRDVLRTAGVDAGHVYHDLASGVRDDTRTQQLGIRACDYCCAESTTNAASASDPVWKASGQLHPRSARSLASCSWRFRSQLVPPRSVKFSLFDLSARPKDAWHPFHGRLGAVLASPHGPEGHLSGPKCLLSHSGPGVSPGGPERSGGRRSR